MNNTLAKNNWRKEKNVRNQIWNTYRKKRRKGEINWTMKNQKHKVIKYAMGLITDEKWKSIKN